MIPLKPGALWKSPMAVGALALFARIALAALFLHEAWFKLTHFDLSVAYMARFGVPGALLPGAIALECGGALALITGIGLRYAALALAGFCVLAALIFHVNWADQNQLLHFEKDFAIAGGLVALALFEAGRQRG